jgi:hypothetical protein
MRSDRVTLGEEIPDDDLRASVAQVATGGVTPEQAWINLQSRRAARPRPDFEAQFADLVPYLSPEPRHGSRYPYDSAGMGWTRSAVLADDLHSAGLQADLAAGLQPSPAGYRASGDVLGATTVPGWKELAEVFLFHSSHFPVLDDPDKNAELTNYRSAVTRGELRLADYYAHERRLLKADKE